MPTVVILVTRLSCHDFVDIHEISGRVGLAPPLFLIIRGSVQQQSIFSLRFYRRSIGPGGKLKKQADFGCFNGLYMLLWNRSLDVRAFDH